MKSVLLTIILFVAAIACRAQSVNISGTVNDKKLHLKWSIDSNELTDRFEVEKSYDGINFTTAALVFTSEKKGSEEYKFYEAAPPAGTIYYRLKIWNYNNGIIFSKVLSFPFKQEKKNDS